MGKTYLIHNKEHRLIEFMEYKAEKLKVHCWFKDKTMYQIFLQQDEEGEFYRKARIEFEEPIIGLEYLRLDGEPRIVPKGKDKLRIRNEFRTQDDFPYMYSVKKDFLKLVMDK